MNVPKYIHYDFVTDVNVDIIKSGPKRSQRAAIYALLPDLDWDETNSAKIINKEKSFKGVTRGVATCTQIRNCVPENNNKK